VSVPALLRRIPPLRDRPATQGDPLNRTTREGATDGTPAAADIAAIDTILIPAFRAADTRAVVAQNRWARREVGLLLLSGLLVVASSIQAVYGDTAQWPSVTVAALGGVSSVLAGTTKSTDARGTYLRARREAERLRLLQRAVARIRLQTVEGTGDTQSESTDEPDVAILPAPKRPRHSDPASERLLDLYVVGRLGEQRAWYLRRQEEFDAAERQGGKARTTFLILATILGAVAAADTGIDGQWLGVAATAVTALSGITTGWMRLQAFDTRARLYELTAARIDVAQADRPPAADPALAADFVGQCEDVLLAEHGAWTTQTPRGAREPSPGAPSA
jgi:hypothetical protein